MLVARTSGAVVWDDEKVLISGGFQGMNNDLSTTEWFDGRNWTDGPLLPYPVTGHCMVRIPGTWDLVLIGGHTHSTGGVGSRLSDTRIFKNANQSWTKMASMNHLRVKPACALLPNGEIWVGGGVNSFTGPVSVEIYTVETNKWREGPTLPPNDNYFAGEFVVSDENLFYLGGYESADILKLNKEKDNWLFVSIYSVITLKCVKRIKDW